MGLAVELSAVATLRRPGIACLHEASANFWVDVACILVGWCLHVIEVCLNLIGVCLHVACMLIGMYSHVV